MASDCYWRRKGQRLVICCACFENASYTELLFCFFGLLRVFSLCFHWELVGPEEVFQCRACLTRLLQITHNSRLHDFLGCVFFLPLRLPYVSVEDKLADTCFTSIILHRADLVFCSVHESLTTISVDLDVLLCDGLLNFQVSGCDLNVKQRLWKVEIHLMSIYSSPKFVLYYHYIWVPDLNIQGSWGIFLEEKSLTIFKKPRKLWQNPKLWYHLIQTKPAVTNCISLTN